MKFKQINNSYLLLTEQCSSINILFGYRIFLGCMSYIAEVVVMLNFTLRLFLGCLEVSATTSYLSLITTITRMTGNISIVLYGLHICEQNYRQTERILRLIDYLLIDNTMNQEEQESLKQLRELIITRPIDFHAAKLFRMEYPTFLSLASVFITSTIILLQNIK
ncbi:uncharacterized protein LOC133320261 [Danaus plexippus]|uniref:uncharacterized protein LOC133320261 n=1 Tax=Danaus plexippus TaxID=13037 RepID=UPI002AB19699|nr:uncharacterized protein LOC133320261 [Danaus plexippus]